MPDLGPIPNTKQYLYQVQPSQLLGCLNQGMHEVLRHSCVQLQ